MNKIDKESVAKANSKPRVSISGSNKIDPKKPLDPSSTILKEVKYDPKTISSSKTINNNGEKQELRPKKGGLKKKPSSDNLDRKPAPKEKENNALNLDKAIENSQRLKELE